MISCLRRVGHLSVSTWLAQSLSLVKSHPPCVYGEYLVLDVEALLYYILASNLSLLRMILFSNLLSFIQPPLPLLFVGLVAGCILKHTL